MRKEIIEYLKEFNSDKKDFLNFNVGVCKLTRNWHTFHIRLSQLDFNIINNCEFNEINIWL